nr:ATP-binding protein [Roseococcus sp. MDT2-1-1]
MRRHVERELGRARRAARGPGTSAAVRYVAERLLRVLSRTEDGARVAWHLDIPEGLRVALHEDDLAEALGTLAENAARFAASAVTLSATPEAGQVIVAVRDDGPGIAEADHAEALRRGGRLDEGGTGLGLAIAREIAEGAGGSLRLGPTGPGRMTVSLVLPAA